MQDHFSFPLKRLELFGKRLRLRYFVLPFLFYFMVLTPALGWYSTNISPKITERQAFIAHPQDATIQLGSGSQSVEHHRPSAAGLFVPSKKTIVPEGKTVVAQATQLAVFKPELKPLEQFRTLKMKSGGTLSGLLTNNKVSSLQAHAAIQALKKEFDPRDLKAGQKIRLDYGYDADGQIYLDKMEIAPTKLERVVVSKNDNGGYDVQKSEKKLITKTEARAGEVKISLFGSGALVGIPNSVLANFIRIYSSEVDFQRDIRAGDKFSLLYETKWTEDGDFVTGGRILKANLQLSGVDNPIYRFEKGDGFVDYYDADGKSIRRALLKTPVDGARMSSGYGMRKHPILGYNKMHKGVDFAAPTGTPIYAAGDGIIERREYQNGYGKYIRIRHGGNLKTAYAHMSKYAKGIVVGKRVKQGDVIAYVGSTGRSTGPHLHYEVLKGGRQVNPRSLKLPTGDQLKSAELKTFKTKVALYDRVYKEKGNGVILASSNPASTE